MNMKRTLHALISVIWLMMIAAPGARAASDPQILQWRLDPDGNRLTLYVRHADGAAVKGVRIGGMSVADAEIARNASETTLVTWILFDNATSMPEGVRAKAEDVLTTLLGERGHGETYNFCAFADRLNVQLRDSASFADLKKKIDGLEYDARRVSVADALEEVLTEESRRTGTEFVRIVIFSAGDDSVSVETATENLRESPVSNIPVYVIGCADGADNGGLSQLYALAERTCARYWNISDIGASDIAKIMRWEEIPLKASLTIPESLRTGTAQEIEVTFSDGSVARSEVIAENVGGDIGDTPQEIGDTSDAPQEIGDTDDTPQENGDTGNTPQENGGNAPQSGISDTSQESGSNAPQGIGDTGDTPQESGDNAPQENDDIGGVEQGDGSGFIALCAVLVLGLVGGGAFLAFRRKNGDKAVSADADPLSVSAGQTFSDSGESGAFSADDSRTLCLQDADSPERRFTAPLRGRVTIGRSEDNAISLSYDKSISRSHCEVYIQNEKLWIRDSNSSGGTYLNGERIANARELRNGAILRLGHVSYKVEIQ